MPGPGPIDPPDDPTDEPPPRCPDIALRGDKNGGVLARSSTRDPIDLETGVPVESQTDLQVMGPGVSFQLHRTFDGLNDVDGPLGNYWVANVSFKRLQQAGSSIELLENASALVTFSLVVSDYVGPPDRSYELTADATAGELTVTKTTTRTQWVFHDFSQASHLRGRLKEVTSENWSAGGEDGAMYAYDSQGALATITTSGAQALQVKFTYSSNGDRITKVELLEGTTKLKEVEYTYFSSGVHHSDLGAAGDLVLVRRSRAVAGGWEDRYTHYRYDSSGRLKGVFTNPAVLKTVADLSGVSSATDLLTKADAYSPGGIELKDYASNWFTYYASDESPTATVTPYNASGEDLTRYLPSSGSYNRDETGMVRSERITVGGCSCGSSPGGVTKHYAYLQIDQGTTPADNEVRYIVVEDTEDAVGQEAGRVIMGTSESGRMLRQLVTDNPNASTPKYWCQSWTTSTAGEYASAERKRYRITEYRKPSAHDVGDLTEVGKFLDPYDDTTGTPWANDEATLRASTAAGCGPTYTYAYDDEGRLLENRVKRGYDSTSEYLLRARTYGDGTTLPSHLLTELCSYPAKTQTKGDGEKLSYAYTFWDTEKTQIKKATLTGEIVIGDENGPDQAVVTEQYFDKLGRPRWYKDGDGYLHYTSYDQVTGAAACWVTDCDDDPTSLPASASASWLVAPTDDGDGDSTYDASGLPTRTAPDPTPLNLVATQQYDTLGRPTVATGTDGSRSVALYEEDRHIFFPKVDASGMPLAPVQVTVLDDTGLTLETYAVGADFTSVATSGSLPTGFSAEPAQDDYVSWTRYAYDGPNRQLIATDNYHNIPSSGTGDISDDFGRTGYRYDSLGRQEYVIQQVAGDPSAGDGVEQVTQTVYDTLGRATASRVGVSKTGHTIGADYQNAGATPTLTTVSETFYDGATTPGALAVGDGHVTRSVVYHTVDGSGMPDDYTVVKNYYDFRGRVRGSEQFANGDSSGDSVGPYTVSDLDWAGRTVATAVYDAPPSWSTITAGDGDAAYADSVATDRRALSRTMYDEAGQVYRTEQATVHADTGAVVAVTRTDLYYDARDNLVASGDPYGVFTEHAYDGAGRQYQQRTVATVASTPYSDVAFQYAAPAPKRDFASMTGGNGGVITLSHTEFDSDGHAIAQHAVELNHDDTDGISLTSGVPTGGVRTTTHNYYNDRDQLVAVFDYGAGGSTEGATTWKPAALPLRDTTDPPDDESDANRMVTTFHYDPATGAQDWIADSKGIKTHTFVDDAGRRTFVVENYVDFAPPGTPTGNPSGMGGGTDNDQDRATRWEYNAAGQVVALTA
jgi:YD repeat-containing protein